MKQLTDHQLTLVPKLKKMGKEGLIKNIADIYYENGTKRNKALKQARSEVRELQKRLGKDVARAYENQYEARRRKNKLAKLDAIANHFVPKTVLRKKQEKA